LAGGGIAISLAAITTAAAFLPLFETIAALFPAAAAIAFFRLTVGVLWCGGMGR
jgi:hypothetical protein